MIPNAKISCPTKQEARTLQDMPTVPESTDSDSLHMFNSLSAAGPGSDVHGALTLLPTATSEAKLEVIEPAAHTKEELCLVPPQQSPTALPGDTDCNYKIVSHSISETMPGSGAMQHELPHPLLAARDCQLPDLIEVAGYRDAGPCSAIFPGLESPRQALTHAPSFTGEDSAILGTADAGNVAVTLSVTNMGVQVACSLKRFEDTSVYSIGSPEEILCVSSPNQQEAPHTSTSEEGNQCCEGKHNRDSVCAEDIGRSPLQVVLDVVQHPFERVLVGLKH